MIGMHCFTAEYAELPLERHAETASGCFDARGSTEYTETATETAHCCFRGH